MKLNKIHFLVDSLGNVIDATQNLFEAEYLRNVLKNQNPFNSVMGGNIKYDIITLEVDGKPNNGLNALTYLYKDGIPYRIILNQLRNIVDITNETLKNTNGSYEVVTKWFISEEE